MPRKRPNPSLGTALAAALLTAILALTLSGCGESAEEAKGPAAATQVNLSDFPETDGRATLRDLQRAVKAKQNVDMLPAANDFVRGRENRLPFGLFRSDRRALWGPTAIYYATSSGAPAVGPFPAPAHPLEVQPRFRSATSRADSGAVGNGYYAVTLPPVDRAAKIGVLALTKTPSGFEAAAVALPLSRKDPTVAPGEPVPAIDTPTGTGTSELDAICTREPHDDMHRISLKDALKLKKPIVLVFSTPKLCASRVCAPVTDIAEEVRAATGDDVIFIHNEIYKDNDLAKGTRPQVSRFGIPGEPFTFVIDAAGRVAAQLQGPFDQGELKAAIAKAKK